MTRRDAIGTHFEILSASASYPFETWRETVALVRVAFATDVLPT
ncbi:hypothetical protein [Haloterrigena gelatinilytica]|nr:hypothetical protein [Haloterrigena gelatinilytica]